MKIVEGFKIKEREKCGIGLEISIGSIDSIVLNFREDERAVRLNHRVGTDSLRVAA